MTTAYRQIEKVAINDTLSLKAARRDAIANLKSSGASGVGHTPATQFR